MRRFGKRNAKLCRLLEFIVFVTGQFQSHLFSYLF